MKYPNKYRIVIKTTDDDKERIVSIIENSLYEDRKHVDILNMLSDGQFESRPYYIDIALSKRFKLYQEMQKENIFNTSVTVKEEEN